MPDTTTPRPTDDPHALTRRSFLGMAAPLAVAWPLAARLEAASKIPIAVQLYSVRGDCKELRRRAREGGGDGLRGRRVRRLLQLRRQAARTAQKLEELNLKVAATHIGTGTLQGDALKKTIEFHQAIGCKFLIVPGDRGFTDPEKSKALAETFNKAAETLKPLGHGLRLPQPHRRVQEGRRQDLLGSLRRAHAART